MRLGRPVDLGLAIGKCGIDIRAAAELNADFVAYDMTSAATGALSDTPPVPLKAPKRMVRRQTSSRKKPAAKAKTPAG